MDEWLIIDLAPVGGSGFTRDGEILKNLFEKFPVDSGWTVLSPPLEILEHRHLDFAEIFEEARQDLQKIPKQKLCEFARSRGFPAIHRRVLWLRLIPETWKFVPVKNHVHADILVQIEKDVHRTIPEKVVFDFPAKLRRVLTNYAAQKYKFPCFLKFPVQLWDTVRV